MSITQPKIVGFVTRSDAGLARPRSRSTNISPENGGTALHYGGDNVPVSAHRDCVRIWKGWQDFHMNTRGWVDIAYTMGVCQHGYAFAGRGTGTRTAANGTNHGNSTHYAVCWIGGARQRPSSAALSAFAWCIQELRKNGRAGLSVKPHSHFRSTGCPGSHIRSAASEVDGQRLDSSGGGGSKTDWEVFFMGLDKKQQEFLEEYSKYYVDQGVAGRSMALQNLLNHRERIPEALELVEAVESAGINLDALAHWTRQAGKSDREFLGELAKKVRVEMSADEVLQSLKYEGSDSTEQEFVDQLNSIIASVKDLANKL